MIKKNSGLLWISPCILQHTFPKRGSDLFVINTYVVFCVYSCSTHSHVQGTTYSFLPFGGSSGFRHLSNLHQFSSKLLTGCRAVVFHFMKLQKECLENTQKKSRKKSVTFGRGDNRWSVFDHRCCGVSAWSSQELAEQGRGRPDLFQSAVSVGVV